jgi:cytochrome c553
MRRVSLMVAWGGAMLMPLAAAAMSAAQQEYSTASRAMPNVAHGMELFDTCAACHGLQGGGQSDGTVPNIAGQHFRVLVKQLVDFRHDKRWDIRMEHFTDDHHLTDAQAIADVAGYASELEWQRTRGVGSGEFVAHGQEVYLLQCKSCHGPKGEGDSEQLAPRLAGQHYEYLLRQLHDAVEGRRPNFPQSHIRLLAKLDRDDFVGVADYLSRLEPAKGGLQASAPEVRLDPVVRSEPFGE